MNPLFLHELLYSSVEDAGKEARRVSATVSIEECVSHFLTVTSATRRNDRSLYVSILSKLQWTRIPQVQLCCLTLLLQVQMPFEPAIATQELKLCCSKSSWQHFRLSWGSRHQVCQTVKGRCTQRSMVLQKLVQQVIQARQVRVHGG
jgi:hypothetical protein